MNVTGTIGKILAVSANISAIVQDRIFPLVVPQGKLLPAITITVLDVVPATNKTNPSRVDTFPVQVSCWARQYSVANDLSEKCRVALDQFQGTVTPGTTPHIVQGIRYDNLVESMDEEGDSPAYLCGATYTIRIKRP